MSENTARQVRKEHNQYYANVIPFAKTYTNQQIKKMGRVKAALKVLFKGRLFDNTKANNSDINLDIKER